MLGGPAPTVISLSNPPVASSPEGWKSTENTASLLCQTIWGTLNFIEPTLAGQCVPSGIRESRSAACVICLPEASCHYV